MPHAIKKKPPSGKKLLEQAEIMVDNLESEDLPALDSTRETGARLGELKSIQRVAKQTEQNIRDGIAETFNTADRRARRAALGFCAAVALGGVAGAVLGGPALLVLPSLIVGGAAPLVTHLAATVYGRKVHSKVRNKYAPLQEQVKSITVELARQEAEILDRRNIMRLARHPEIDQLRAAYPDLQKHFADAYVTLSRNLAPLNAPVNDAPPPRKTPDAKIR